MFLTNHLNPHVNYHRPCFFPEVGTNSRGKRKKSHPFEKMMTPYEKLKSLPGAEGNSGLSPLSFQYHF
uniref:Uncharacterized protein n=1 Tax=Candidatus Kentrum sp. TC TaxID=2126339 RepID=A0A450YTY4_9GAMM|nr:MAG: hypothetical protein BECKTC1821D_GA0114238_102327 [Candidatus Kentron sp. TC]